jgi:peptidoglycan/LPS O-acetylase OafA/YrhL
MRRVGRLWPLHVVTLSATVLMAIAGSLLGLSIQGFVYEAIPANLAMVHSWGFLDRLTWNGPSWSISTEMFAYILFALLGWRLRGVLLDIACALVLAASLLVLAHSPSGFGSTYDFGIARCLVGFMAGVLAARLWELTHVRPSGETVAVVVTFAAVAFLPDELSGLVVPLFAWTVLVFASDAGVISRILKTAVPQLLGRVSYSIYMTHYIVGLTIITGLTLLTGLTQEVDGTEAVVAAWWVADAFSLGYLAAVVAISCLTYAWIERPGRHWFNQRAEAIPAAW